MAPGSDISSDEEEQAKRPLTAAELIKRKKERKKRKHEKVLKQLEGKKRRKEQEEREEKEAFNKEEEEEEDKDKGRSYTLSVALPGSILDNAQSPELRTYLAGQVARALAVFNVDEVVVFDDEGKSGKGEPCNGCGKS